MTLQKIDTTAIGAGYHLSQKADFAFISHMVEAAVEKEGRIAVVVPHGVLFRGAAEGRIRQKMIEEKLTRCCYWPAWKPIP